MKLGPEGAAYFVEKVEKLNEEDSVVNSPISSKNNIKILQEKSSKSQKNQFHNDFNSYVDLNGNQENSFQQGGLNEIYKNEDIDVQNENLLVN